MKVLDVEKAYGASSVVSRSFEKPVRVDSTTIVGGDLQLFAQVLIPMARPLSRRAWLRDRRSQPGRTYAFEPAR